MTRSSTRQRTEAHASPGSDPGSARRDQPPIAQFAWRSWPIRDEWRRIWPVAAAIVLASVVIGVATGKLELSLLAFVAQALAAWRLLLPIDYEVNSQGIEQRIFGRSVKMSWTAIRRHEVRRDGIVLFRDAEARPFDAWRGIYLPWNRHRAAVLAALAPIIRSDEVL